jgi:hypothetical protein
MKRECIRQTNNTNERWKGIITRLKNLGSHYEINIETRPRIMVLFGRTSQGGFAYMPD